MCATGDSVGDGQLHDCIASCRIMSHRVVSSGRAGEARAKEKVKRKVKSKQRAAAEASKQLSEGEQERRALKKAKKKAKKELGLATYDVGQQAMPMLLVTHHTFRSSTSCAHTQTRPPARPS